MRNGSDRRPETHRMHSPKVALMKIPMVSVQYNTDTVESMMTRIMSTAFMCSRNSLSSHSPLC